MKLLALAGDINALMAQIRLVTPLTALCKMQGWPLAMKSFHDCSHSDLAQAEVLVVQRAASSRALRLQQRMHLLGGAVVYDIDDLLTDVAPHISNRDGVQKRVLMLRRCMHEADVVSVSTARLGRELGRDLGQDLGQDLGRDLGLQHALEVPNHALPLPDLPMPAHQPGQPVTLLFASSEYLATDFIYPAVRALDGVRVVVVGPPAAGFQRAGITVQAEPLMPRERFVAFARSLPNALAVIPLEESRFAACKSAVKWFDYAAAGIPTLCSAVSPYLEVVSDGVTGALVANDSQAWQAALQRAVDDDCWRLRIATAARAHVATHHDQRHTVDAWQRAILKARQVSQLASRPKLGLSWHVQGTLAAAFEGVALRLRSFNRARLAKRPRR